MGRMLCNLQKSYAAQLACCVHYVTFRHTAIEFPQMFPTPNSQNCNSIRNLLRTISSAADYFLTESGLPG